MVPVVTTFFFLLLAQGLKPRAVCMLGKSPTTGLHPQALVKGSTVNCWL